MNEEILFSCIIPGRPGIKKNGKKICRNHRTGRRFIGSSDAYERWAQSIWYIVKSAKKDILINFPINLCAKFYFKNHQWEPDLSNCYEGIQDVMQECGIYVDDCFIHSHDGSRKIFNDPNERIEITITRLQE